MWLVVDAVYRQICSCVHRNVKKPTFQGVLPGRPLPIDYMSYWYFANECL